jgi:hypothetical protein
MHPDSFVEIHFHTRKLLFMIQKTHILKWLLEFVSFEPHFLIREMDSLLAYGISRWLTP